MMKTFLTLGIAALLGMTVVSAMPTSTSAQEGKALACWYDPHGSFTGADSCTIGQSLAGAPCTEPGVVCQAFAGGTCRGPDDQSAGGEHAQYFILSPGEWKDGNSCPRELPKLAHEPSDGAKGMAGAEGTFAFTPTDWQGDGTTTWWIDTDGVDPGKAGCHLGRTAQGEPNGRMFGEACTPAGLLVESNPGAQVLHDHKKDIGHPDLFDCSLWCKGRGSEGGACIPAPAPPCTSSARCDCK